MSEHEEVKSAGADGTPLAASLMKTRSVIISGEINQRLAQDVVTQLLILQDAGDEPIQLFLNSQGGHVEAADTIHDVIQFIKPTVNIIGTGWVASAGITILLAAEKEHRYALPNTRFMIHQPLGGVQGQASDIAIEAGQIIQTLERINRLISDATGQPYDKVKKDTDRNYWMTAAEAIDYGIISRIIKRQSELG